MFEVFYLSFYVTKLFKVVFSLMNIIDCDLT